MNRTQRRSESRRGRAPELHNFAGGQAAIADLIDRARAHNDRGELSTAAHLYKKVLAVRPDLALARERLAGIYLMQGKRDKASAEYAEFVRTMPQTLTQFTKVLETLKVLLPDLAAELAATSGAPATEAAGKRLADNQPAG